jgi:ATP-dependent DNA helicase RecQ
LPAIVYAGTRGASEALAADLSRELGEEVLAYHAGLDRERRASVQERFMSGAVPVIVAPNAFGMGIDKANVRTVCHASVPQSLEAYYQEAGRAGRDGGAARCLLFAERRDKGLHVFFIERARVEDGAFERVAERLRWAGADGRYDIPLQELAGVAGGSGGRGRGRARGGRGAGEANGRGEEEAARAVIGHLARAGVVAPSPSPPDRAVGRLVGDWDGRAMATCRTSARDAEQVRWRQYRSVWEYVERAQCRRVAILRHFGDRAAPSPTVDCCDACVPGLVAPPAPPPLAARSGGGLPPQAARSGGGLPPQAGSDLDEAILETVLAAEPPVGRTRAVEILRGGRSKVVVGYAYDGLRAYGAFAHLRAEEVLGRVDELLAAGKLRSTGGRFPKLRAA